MDADEKRGEPTFWRRWWCWLTTRHRYCHRIDKLTERVRLYRYGWSKTRHCNRCHHEF